MSDIGLWSGTLPAIPESFVDPVSVDTALLLWVRHGALVVGRDGHADLRAEAGQAIWIPPRVLHTNATDPGSVVLPIAVDLRDGDALPAIAVVTVPDEWADWLAYRMSRSLGFAAGAEPDRSRLLDLLSGIAPVAGAPSPRLPRMPSSPAARTVIETLLRDPASVDSLADRAAQVALSPRTLQRHLRDETGHGFEQWRTSARIEAAASHLARGEGVGQAAHRVGYASVSGFAHAFSHRMGVSPGRYARARRSQGHHSDPVVGLIGDPGAAPPPLVPGDGPTQWVSHFDAVRWVYRGTASVEVGGVRQELRAGDVFWIGRGVPFVLEIDPGSIMLPLGWRSEQRGLRGVRLLRMPQREEVELYLLHVAVANHFLLRPRGHDPGAFRDVLRPAYAVHQDLGPDLQTIVDAVVGDPSDDRGLEEWAEKLSRSAAGLRREFVATMGETFPRWRTTVRMSAARELMWAGHSPSAVARRLGYRHLSGFSRAFTRVHRMSPSEWLRRSSD